MSTHSEQMHAPEGLARCPIMPTYGPPPVMFVRGEGSWLFDPDGKKYLDFSSQLINLNLGHQHPKMIAAIQEQAAKLATIAPGMATDARSTAARMIAERTPGDLNKIFLLKFNHLRKRDLNFLKNLT